MQTLNRQVPAFHSTSGTANDGYSYDGTFTVNESAFSYPINVAFIRTLSVQFSCPATGTPSGTLVIQGCNDNSSAGTVANNTLQNFSTLSFWDEASGAWLQSKTISGASNFVLTCPVLSTQWVRLSLTNTSGTMLPTIKLMLKE